MKANSMKRKAFCIVVLMLLCHMALGSNEFVQLTFQISTGSPTALPMEPIPITISLSNNTNGSIWACPVISPDSADFRPNTGICEIFVKSEGGEFEFFPPAGWLKGSAPIRRKVELDPGYRKQVNGFLYFAQLKRPSSFDPNNFSKQHLLPEPGGYQIKAVLKSLDNQGKIESNILMIRVLQPTGENALAYEYMRNTRKPYFLMRIFGGGRGGKTRQFISAQEDFLRQFPTSKYARYVNYSLGHTYTIKRGDFLNSGMKMLEQAADYEDFFLANKALSWLITISLKNDNVDKAQYYHNILKTRSPNSSEYKEASYEISNILSHRKK